MSLTASSCCSPKAHRAPPCIKNGTLSSRTLLLTPHIMRRSFDSFPRPTSAGSICPAAIRKDVHAQCTSIFSSGCSALGLWIWHKWRRSLGVRSCGKKRNQSSTRGLMAFRSWRSSIRIAEGPSKRCSVSMDNSHFNAQPYETKGASPRAQLMLTALPSSQECAGMIDISADACSLLGIGTIVIG